MEEKEPYKERDLLLRISAGDEAAFQVLHHHYWNEIYSLALAFMKSAEVAEDVLQEVFIKLWLKRDKLPEIEKFESFLFVMVRNELISALRKWKKLIKDKDDYLLTVITSSSPESNIETREVGELVKEALSELTPQQQQIFKMSREEGLSHEAIASQLGLSKKTVSNTITLVLNSIRVHLYRKGHIIVSLLAFFSGRN